MLRIIKRNLKFLGGAPRAETLGRGRRRRRGEAEKIRETWGLAHDGALQRRAICPGVASLSTCPRMDASTA